MTEKALSYGRASRDPKHRGTSVDSQLKANAEWAKHNGVTILRTLRDDNRSASAARTKDREDFELALEIIGNREVDMLLVWEMSRATRDLADYVLLRQACMEAGAHLVYKGRRYDLSRSDDQFTTGLDALMAEREAGDIRERNIRTVRDTAERRRPHGRLPYGYRRIYDESNGTLLTQTPYDNAGDLLPEAQVLADATRDLLSGVTLRRVCRHLNERRIPSPRKPRKKTLEESPADVVDLWERATLRQLLLNPTIAGRRIYQGEDIGPAGWEPIIDYDQWLRLKSLLTDPSRLTVPVPRGPAPRHLLTGIARCGVCGSRLKAATNLKRLKKAYLCRHEGCMKVTVTGEKVDAMVEATVLALFDRPDFRSSLAAAHRDRDELRSNGPDIGAQIAELEKERDVLEAMRAEEPPSISRRAYAAEDLRLEKAIERLRESEVKSMSSPAIRRILGASTLKDAWGAADLMDRREIVRMLFDIRVNRPERNTGQRFDPNRVVVKPSAFLLDDVLNGQSTTIAL